MGGSAFAMAYAEGEPTLNTPRMSPELYRRLKSIYVQKLQDYIPTGRVVPLVEAPEKADYGDLDIFVASDQQVDFIDLANYLGVAGVIPHDSRKATFGVRQNGLVSDRPCVVYRAANSNKTSQNGHSSVQTAEKYTQIDVSIVSPDLLDWYTFYSGHSDMNGLLGRIVTHLGFRVTDRGFVLRIPELDLSKTLDYVNVPDRDGMVSLSHDPDMVIRFLGCSVEDYHAGFATVEQLYQWLGACRMISSEALQMRWNNAHDRNWEWKRSIYTRFFHEWLPTHMDMKTEDDEVVRAAIVRGLRQEYLEEAVDFFGKREEYRTKRDAIILAINNGLAADLLKPLIAQHSGKRDKHMNEILKAFRRYVGFENGKQPIILSVPQADEESELYNFLNDERTELGDLEMANEWVKKNWEALRELVRKRAKAGPGSNP